MTESYFFDAVRNLFAALDRVVYSLISVFYEVMINLSKISILEIDQIESFASKIYALLAVFMVFKVTFSLINYLVNPDKMLDSSKGIQKILMNIILSLAMIIIAPKAFVTLYDVQNAILDDEVIPKFFMGGVTQKNTIVVSPLCMGSVTIENDGDRFAFIIFRSFYQPEWSRKILGITSDEFAKMSDDNKIEISNEWLTESNSDAQPYCNSTSVREILKNSIVNSAPGTKDLYLIDYQFLISTIIGVAVFAIIVSFCFDIAVRSIRLSFLQLIAPIPIVSYIDPDSSKNGMFKKWLKDVGKTWASLFIRLLSIYFAIYLIDIIADSAGKFTDIRGNILNLSHSFWVNVFLIIGILMFAKKLPSLIEGILGIKFDGKFEINPLKRVASDSMFGKQVSGFTTGTLSKAGSFGRNLVANRGKNFKENVRKSWNDSKGSFAAGYKAPGTLTGYKEGTKQLKEDKKNRKAAEMQLKEYDDMAEKGEKLLEEAFVYDENGNHVMKPGTNEYKTDDSKIFTHSAYIASFKNVDKLKGDMISKENIYDSKDKIYSATLNKYGVNSKEAEAARIERDTAKKEYNAAKGKYDLAVKQHDEYKKIYKDDAEREETLSFYKKTHGDKLIDSANAPLNNSSGSVGISSGSTGTSSGSVGISSGSTRTSSGSVGTSSGSVGTSSGSVGTSSENIDNEIDSSVNDDIIEISESSEQNPKQINPKEKLYSLDKKVFDDISEWFAFVQKYINIIETKIIEYRKLYNSLSYGTVQKNKVASDISELEQVKAIIKSKNLDLKVISYKVEDLFSIEKFDSNCEKKYKELFSMYEKIKIDINNCVGDIKKIIKGDELNG